MPQWSSARTGFWCGAHERAGSVPKLELSQRAPLFWDIPMIGFFRSRSDGSFKARSLERDSTVTATP